MARTALEASIGQAAGGDPKPRWALVGVALLWFGAGGGWPHKTLQGQAFTRFPGLIGMMENEPEVNISKVVGPTSSSSSNGIK